MAKYGKKTQEHVEDTMHKMKRGTLKSGKGGKGGKVKNRKQAVAIALSEAREKGYKAPAEKKSSPRGKSKGAKKTTHRSASSSKSRSSRSPSARSRSTSRSRSRSSK
jgi:hypothetical protein